MRKFEQVKDIETIKRMAIAGWPIKDYSSVIEYCNEKVIAYEDAYDLWEEVEVSDFTILPPEITLKEARERIKSGVVYASSKHFALNYCQVMNFNYHTGTISYRMSQNLENKVFQEDCIYYPFDPTPFSDLLEEVEEKANERPALDGGGRFIYEDKHLRRIYSELDKLTAKIEALEQENNELTETNHKLLCGFDLLAQRIGKLEGKK